MDLCIKFLLRFVLKNKVLKPYHALLNLSRDSFTQDNNLITLFTKYYHVAYIELKLKDEIPLCIFFCLRYASFDKLRNHRYSGSNSDQRTNLKLEPTPKSVFPSLRTK